MTAAELLVRCLENEGVETVFGIPGEENIDVMDALLESGVRFITTRHEQGAAFMADVHGRLTGRAGVCLATLGPGACNLVTGAADANMDRAPVVALVGQADTTRMHKESHQHVDLCALFAPIAKYTAQIREPEIVPEVLRKAFKVAETEKPGLSFVEIPENVAAMDTGAEPLKRQSPRAPYPPPDKVEQAAALLGEARSPILLAGNGVVRAGASAALRAFAEKLNVPVANTFMAKGVLPASHPLSLGSVGLQSRDHADTGFDVADVILCVGYDMVEYPPELWRPQKQGRLIHVDRTPAEVDEHYVLDVGVIGDIGESLEQIAERVTPRECSPVLKLREVIEAEFSAHAGDTAFPVKPQKLVWDLRRVLRDDDIVISDVGAHKMWMARMYEAEVPNTCLISNGFASMGIALPGAVAAKRVHPERRVVAVTGDAGFLMNSQEIETALRVGTAFVVLIWSDAKYGLIEWHQQRKFGRPAFVDFRNPDFVKYAESFGARGYRVERTADLVPTLERALADDTVAVVDCPVDYAENMKLTERLGALRRKI